MTGSLGREFSRAYHATPIIAARWLFRRSLLVAHDLGFVLVFALLTASVPKPTIADASFKTRGRWTPIAPYQWGDSATLTPGYGTHLVVLRGNTVLSAQPDTTWVLHWHDGISERIWLSKPLIDRYFSPDSGYAAVPIAEGDRLFCAGQGSLPDGRALVVGGTAVQHSGLGHGNVFDPTKYKDAVTHGWTKTPDLQEGRWYPSLTMLGNGTAIAFSGHWFYEMFMFGGVNASGTRLNDERPLKLMTTPAWAAQPSLDDRRPAPREGMSSFLSGSSGRWFLFGGEDASGFSDSLLALVRVKLDVGDRWKWESWMKSGSPTRPSARSRHTAVGNLDTMYVFGGLGSGGALSDLWRFVGTFTDTSWVQLSVSGGPGARYGHSAMYVPAKRGVAGSVPQMLVWGGRTSSTSFADGNTLWVLRLVPGQEQWTSINLSGSAPSSREGHAWAMDGNTNRDIHRNRRRVYLFGGEGAAGALPRDTWFLSRPETSTGTDNDWTWTQLATTGMPVGRTRHVGIADDEFERFLLFGGDTNGSSTAGGQTDSLWSLQFRPVVLADTIKWVAVAQDSIPAARSANCAVYNPGPIFAQIPEQFTPSSTSPPGAWTPLTAASKFQPYYPHTFLTSSGKLFWAGNDDTNNGISWKFDPVTLAWAVADTAVSGFSGGCSVMYLPDSVLKTGLQEDTPGNNARIAIVPTSGKANWNAKNILTMKESRAYHNLTMLPTGEVLLTGGQNASAVPQHVPYLWNPSGVAWSDSLAPDPADRKYHSTAILLPDARVLTAGGPPSDLGASAFWPPYLFNNDGTLATRPQINGITYPCTDTIQYNSTFSVSCDSAGLVRSVCLIKPSAVTHQLNMNQRYVQLPFAYVDPTDISVSAPKSINHAPPGDYLMFVVKSSLTNSYLVPSVARWVRVGPDTKRPGPTTNLSQDLATTNTVLLVWTSAGDDSMCGKAGGYSLRHATVPITNANFDSVGVKADSAGIGIYAYDDKIATVTGLTPCTQYYFALKTRDEAVYLSSLSNVAAIKTACGGGGGGLMASSGGPGYGRPRNVLLATATGTASKTDLLWVGAATASSDSTYRMSLLTPYESRVTLGGIRMIAVNRSPGTRSVVVHGRIVTGIVSDPTSIQVGSASITNELQQNTSIGFAVSGSDTMNTVILGAMTTGRSLLLDVSYRADAEPVAAGVTVQSFDPKAGWSAGRFYPTRPLRDAIVVDSLAGDSVRVMFTGGHTLGSVGVFTPLAKQPQLSDLQLTTADHSRLGTVLEEISSGGAGVTISPGENVTLTFTGPSLAGFERDLFLSASGSWTPLTGAAQLRSVSEGVTLPRTFVLYSPRPNPSHSATSIRFDLPRASQVSIDIFDVQGRRVETLVHGLRLPGSYDVQWRHSGTGGAGASPGLYLCRMVADAFISRQKIVLLP